MTRCRSRTAKKVLNRGPELKRQSRTAEAAASASAAEGIKRADVGNVKIEVESCRIVPLDTHVLQDRRVAYRDCHRVRNPSRVRPCRIRHDEGSYRSVGDRCTDRARDNLSASARLKAYGLKRIVRALEAKLPGRYRVIGSVLDIRRRDGRIVVNAEGREDSRQREAQKQKQFFHLILRLRVLVIHSDGPGYRTDG